MKPLEHLGPTKLFIKYVLNNQLHCTESFPPQELAAKVKELKAQNIKTMTIHYTNNPPQDHTT